MQIIIDNQEIQVKKIEFDLNKDGSYDIWYYDEDDNYYHDLSVDDEMNCPYILKKNL